MQGRSFLVELDPVDKSTLCLYPVLLVVLFKRLLSLIVWDWKGDKGLCFFFFAYPYLSSSARSPLILPKPHWTCKWCLWVGAFDNYKSQGTHVELMLILCSPHEAPGIWCYTWQSTVFSEENALKTLSGIIFYSFFVVYPSFLGVQLQYKTEDMVSIHAGNPQMQWFPTIFHLHTIGSPFS